MPYKMLSIQLIQLVENSSCIFIVFYRTTSCTKPAIRPPQKCTTLDLHRTEQDHMCTMTVTLFYLLTLSARTLKWFVGIHSIFYDILRYFNFLCTIRIVIVSLHSTGWKFLLYFCIIFYTISFCTKQPAIGPPPKNSQH